MGCRWGREWSHGTAGQALECQQGMNRRGRDGMRAGRQVGGQKDITNRKDLLCSSPWTSGVWEEGATFGNRCQAISSHETDFYGTLRRTQPDALPHGMIHETERVARLDCRGKYQDQVLFPNHACWISFSSPWVLTGYLRWPQILRTSSNVTQDRDGDGDSKLVVIIQWLLQTKHLVSILTDCSTWLSTLVTWKVSYVVIDHSAWTDLSFQFALPIFT